MNIRPNITGDIRVICSSSVSIVQLVDPFIERKFIRAHHKDIHTGGRINTPKNKVDVCHGHVAFAPGRVNTFCQRGLDIGTVVNLSAQIRQLL